ncbi:hypothetical protein V6R86_07655 [Sphingomonas kaistensis]|uniref:WsaF C-terminal domain-containing protein n=1 Tax=Sphingomonas kaistensis TaxID=298708 RepID=A0ABZ2G0C9_9SPHN
MAQFDPQYYLEAYPDVALSGMDPLEHFLWIGQKLGRRPVGPRETDDSSRFTLDALFIDGTNGTSSTPYRVHRIANGLRDEGWKVQCENGEDMFTLLERDLRPRLVVIHRAPFWSPYPEFVQKMRGLGSVIVYDIDDLVFDESVIPFIDGFKYLSESSKVAFLAGVNAYRDFILDADLCTTTTSFLVDRMRQMGKPAFRIPNAISADNIAFFENVGYRRKGRPAPFVIGYYSGTRTHQADFRVVAPALIEFMREMPDVVFRLVGEFDLSEYPELEYWQHVHKVGDLPRVTRVGLMPHDAMIRDQFSCDLIIAPLEVGNPFCEAKSELKFFEASLAGCPVIASSTQTFTEASENGRLADLATTTEDWLNSFKNIYNNYPIMLNRAVHAFHGVRVNYSQRFAAETAIEVYEQFIGTKSSKGSEPQRVASGPADIGVILPDFSGPSGGHRKIFTVCQALEELGFSLKLYFYSNRSPARIGADLGRLFGHLDAEIAIFAGEVDAHNDVICTQWKTTYDFRKVEFAGRIINFVQDYEPMFHPVGSDYLRALVSYRLNYEIICYGLWVQAKIHDELGVEAKALPFTVDHTVYAPPSSEGTRDVDVLVFARPGQDRRCFDIIVEALIELKSRMPGISIGLFGEKEYDDIGIAVENFGSFDNLSDLAKLYHRAKVGICFSPTNPSQLGYEMIACGVNVVDTRIKFSELNFGGDAFVTYCDGTPESLADACQHLLNDDAEMERRRSRGYAYVEQMPDDSELGQFFVQAAGLGTEIAEVAAPPRKGAAKVPFAKSLRRLGL